jgi:hypothetical protein
MEKYDNARQEAEDALQKKLLDLRDLEKHEREKELEHFHEIERLKKLQKDEEAEIAKLGQERQSEKDKLKALQDEQLEKREEAIEQQKAIEKQKQEDEAQKLKENLQEQETTHEKGAEEPSETEKIDAPLEVDESDSGSEGKGSNEKDEYPACIQLELDQVTHDRWVCIECDVSLGYTLENGKCVKDALEQELTEKVQEQNEQDQENKMEDLEIQKGLFQNCGEYQIDKILNKVLACTDCEESYKLVQSQCYPDDMPSKCIKFSQFLRNYEIENGSADENLCQEEDKDTKMCNVCVPGARLNVCGTCVSANISGSRQCLYDFDMNLEEETPMFYCQKGRLLQKPNYRHDAKNRQDAKNRHGKGNVGEETSNGFMMAPSLREIVSMLQRPLYGN